MKTFKRTLLLVVLIISLCTISHAQLSLNSQGAVTIGSSPSGSNATWLNIYGNQGSSGQRNFRVTYPSGFGLTNTELAGLAHIGVWTALYAKQGSASYAGYFDGYCYVNGNFYYTSDSRLKKNVRDINSPLGMILNMKGVQYDFLADSSINSPEVKDLRDKMSKGNYGFLAQDIMKISPELVVLDPASEKYAINYNGFIPILVEALKEQNITIEDLQQEIENLKKDAGMLKSASNNNTGINTGKNILYQNTPNPFSQNSQIRYFIADNVTDAAIYIYDMNGTQLEKHELHQRGDGNITTIINQMLSKLGLTIIKNKLKTLNNLNQIIWKLLEDGRHY